MGWTLMRKRPGYLQAEELPTTPYWWVQQESKGLDIPLGGSSGVKGPSHPSCSCGRVRPGFPDLLCPGYTVKGFAIVNKGEVDVFLELSCFFNDRMDVGNLISGSSAFTKSS